MKEPDEGGNSASISERIERKSMRMELSDPDAGLGRTNRSVNRLVEVIGVAALASIVAVVFANATSRYLLNNSFSWAEEAVQMIIPWLAMAGVFLSIRRGTVIKIDFFFEKMSERWRRFVARAGLVFNCMVLAMLAYVSYDFVRLFGGDMSLYVGLPVGFSTSALVFGAAGASMAYAAAFVSAVLGRGTTPAGGTR